MYNSRGYKGKKSTKAKRGQEATLNGRSASVNPGPRWLFFGATLSSFLVRYICSAWRRRFYGDLHHLELRANVRGGILPCHELGIVGHRHIAGRALLLWYEIPERSFIYAYRTVTIIRWWRIGKWLSSGHLPVWGFLSSLAHSGP